jgi:hypothetical protein
MSAVPASNECIYMKNIIHNFQRIRFYVLLSLFVLTNLFVIVFYFLGSDVIFVLLLCASSLLVLPHFEKKYSAMPFISDFKRRMIVYGASAVVCFLLCAYSYCTLTVRGVTLSDEIQTSHAMIQKNDLASAKVLVEKLMSTYPGNTDIRNAYSEFKSAESENRKHYFAQHAKDVRQMYAYIEKSQFIKAEYILRNLEKKSPDYALMELQNYYTDRLHRKEIDDGVKKINALIKNEKYGEAVSLSKKLCEKYPYNRSLSSLQVKSQNLLNKRRFTSRLNGFLFINIVAVTIFILCIAYYIYVNKKKPVKSARKAVVIPVFKTIRNMFIFDIMFAVAGNIVVCLYGFIFL